MSHDIILLFLYLDSYIAFESVYRNLPYFHAKSFLPHYRKTKIKLHEINMHAQYGSIAKMMKI